VSIHGAIIDPHLSRLRDAIFLELRAVMSNANFQAMTRCAQRLHASLREPRQLNQNVVLAAYGGGKDSSYTLAFVRATQLLLHRVYGTTFKLRVVTNRHAGMPRAVMENIDHAYSALRIQDDPDCETLLVDGARVRPFDRNEPLPPDVTARNRLDLLLTGHRTHGEGRPTFCNACNLSMVNAFGLAAGHGSGVQLIITGDSPEEQRAYSRWVSRLALRSGQRLRREARAGARGFLRTADDIARAYFSEIHGADSPELANGRRVAFDVPEDVRFFSIYDDTAYSCAVNPYCVTSSSGAVVLVEQAAQTIAAFHWAGHRHLG